MNKIELFVGLLIGFIIGIITTVVVIEYFTILLINSIPPGIVENFNMTISFNETELVEAMNQSGAFDQ